MGRLILRCIGTRYLTRAFSQRFVMSKPKVLVTNGEVQPTVLKFLEEKCKVVVCPEMPYPSRDDILKRISGVDALFWLTGEKLDREMLDAAGPGLRVVSTMSAGYDHVDVPELKSRGIKFGNTPNVLNDSVAEIAVALVLSTAHRLQEGRHKIDSGDWERGRPTWMLGQQVAGSTVGIVGLGGIGCAIANRIKAFGVAELLYSGPRPKPEGEKLGARYVSFDDLLNQSDFVIISCPLNDHTTNLFNKEAFSKMKSNAILVNISRGGVVDQEALITALKTGQIWGAGLDVMVPEPLPKDHPLVELKNCVLIPHLGSATVKTRLAMAQLTADNILAALEGRQMLAPVL